jgi:hypothetical protein
MAKAEDGIGQRVKQARPFAVFSRSPARADAFKKSRQIMASWQNGCDIFWG